MVIESAQYDLKNTNGEFNAIIYQNIRTSFVTNDGIKEKTCREYETLSENIQAMGIMSIINIEGKYIDPSITLMYVNKNIEKLSGFKHQDVLTSYYKCMTDVKCKDLNAIANRDLRVRLREGISALVIYNNITSDNTEIKTMVYCFPIYNRNTSGFIDILACSVSLVVGNEVKITRNMKMTFCKYADKIMQKTYNFILFVNQEGQINNVVISLDVKYKFIEETILNDSIFTFCESTDTKMNETDDVFTLNSKIFQNVECYRLSHFRSDTIYRIVIII
jgi:hypothetical protein